MTRRRSPWPVAIALMLAAGRASLAQNPPVPTPPPTPTQATPPMPPPPGTPAAPAFPPPPVKGGPPGVAAVANGQSISTAQVQRLALSMAGQQALRQILSNLLIDQAAKKQAVTATPAEINARLVPLRQQIESGYPGGLNAYLQSRGTTLAALKTNLRILIEAEKLATKGQKPIHRAHIHYIVVLTRPNPDPSQKQHTDAEAKAIIAKAQADLKAGQSFESVVAKYSEDPGKSNGGDIGVIGPQSVQNFDPTFVQAALALKSGEVTATPVYSAQFGYFLMRAVSTSESPGPDKALYAQTDQQDSRQQVAAYFQTLLKSAKITNYLMP